MVQQHAMSYSKLDHPRALSCIFHPRRDVASGPPQDAVDHDIAVDAGVAIGCRFYLTDRTCPHILFFHGNGEIVSDYDDVGPLYNGFGLSLLAVDYRGYGRSNGTPTVSSMIQDSHVLFHQVRAWLRQHNRHGPLIVMGRSLGSASAFELAACYGDEIDGLIIESGFAHTVPLLQFLGADTQTLSITEEDCFRHTDKIVRCEKPTLFIHAQHDQFIPAADAEALFRLSPAHNKDLKIIEGADHNTLLMMAGTAYFEAIRSFAMTI